jgi:hypothetical protein
MSTLLLDAKEKFVAPTTLVCCVMVMPASARSAKYLSSSFAGVADGQARKEHRITNDPAGLWGLLLGFSFLVPHFKAVSIC